MTWVLTLVASQTYLDKAFGTIRQARSVGKWTDDVVLIIPNDVTLSDENRRIVDLLRVMIRVVRPKNLSRIIGFWERHSTHPQYDYLTKRPGLYLKYNVFDTYFKQWDTVAYLDAGAVVLGDFGRIKTSCEPRGWLYAHCDGYPTYEWKLGCQFAFDVFDPREAHMMKRKYAMGCDYFQSTLMIFSSSILEPGLPDKLFALHERYPISTTGDQAILNLYFLLERGLWRPLPVRDDRGFLYDFHERDGCTANDYVVLKYPTSLTEPLHVE